jgi:4-hydroxybenzoate polyprenyltransferase
LIYEVRPWQWYKQAILFLAVVFSGEAVDPNAWLQATAGATLFSAMAGATYIFNDVNDLEEDRKHPRKRHRPIASGQVSVPLALAVGSVIYAVSGYLAWRLNTQFFYLIALYVGQNVLYTLVFKKYMLMDLLSISFGFVIRAISGVVLISVELSPWLILCTFLAALMIGVSKRLGERAEVSEPTEIRESLGGYTEELLKFMFASVATMLLISYSLYTFFTHGLITMCTIPFAFYAVFRYAHLTLVNDGASEPVELLLDRGIVANFVLWGATTMIVIYLGIPGGAI